MQVFIMHVGHPGNVDIEYTVTRKRTIQELIEGLSEDSEEQRYFKNNVAFSKSFPCGKFNCWGVPINAEPSFRKTMVGDLILIIPWIGIHDGGVHHIGIVKHICHIRCYNSSRILWPNSPDDRRFPFIFFFDTETGFRPWFEFLDDLKYDANWNPQGWYRRVAANRFNHFGGPEGYLTFLREKIGFRPI
jgi:hypothetical protein